MDGSDGRADRRVLRCPRAGRRPSGVRSGPCRRTRSPRTRSTSRSPVSATTPSTTWPPGTSSARCTPRSSRARGHDTVLLLEHPPVFTAGKRTDPHERPLDPGGAPVIDVDRGGKITFHGPGQLVGYPIVQLPDHVKVVDYVRRVEEALIARLRRPRRHHRPRPGPQRRVAARPTSAAPSARSPPSASGSAGASRCTASPSTATSTSAGTTASSRAASPTPASPRCAASSVATSRSPRCCPPYAVTSTRTSPGLATTRRRLRRPPEPATPRIERSGPAAGPGSARLSCIPSRPV